ncbi:unnamed protein product [Clonostachys byssicola]|uniref:Beta-glucosidase cel3A n=1 Tax=Clonostachys byssicola TaxID=160290 RepID=A0A9N9UQA8_9HYPO|nr:unnamed protein product [Clonostachys byssicola]
MTFKIIAFILCLATFASSFSNDEWSKASEKAKIFTLQLTIEEKIAFTYGNATAGAGCIGVIPPIPRLNFTGVCMSDGPNAVNRAEFITVFPSGITAAATWDRNLIYQRAHALGEEARGKGTKVLLGPAVGPMGRHGLGGRNWEGFGPDPFLAGEAMEATVRGIQDNGVQTSSKHYILNEQETQRTNTTSENGSPVDAISSNADDRTLHELYLWPFANAVKAGTTSIMCSYNRVNQTYTCENSYLLKEILREELGFAGYVVSDWFATHSAAKAINAGLEVEMPGYIPPSNYQGASFFFKDGLTKGLEDGSITEDRLNEMVQHIMTPYFLLKQDSPDYPSPDPSSSLLLLANDVGLLNLIDLGVLPQPGQFPRGRDVRGNHAAVVREVAAAGTVLLKNTNQTLPLKSPKVIGVFGNDAVEPANGLVVQDLDKISSGSNIGNAFIGGGSGTGRATSIVTPLEAIRTKAKEIGAEVQYIATNELLAAGNFKSIYPLPDLCLVFQKTFASEGSDRTSWELDNNSTAAIRNVAKLCGNTVVVTHSGGVVTLPWADEPKIGAILAAHYPGEQSGNSIVDILWGDVNPSGRLPYTIPFKGEDSGPPIVNLTEPVKDQGAWQADFSEGQLIDYRHYDAMNITPRYEFGFGLSYTAFELGNGGKVEGSSLTNNSLSARPNPDVKVEVGGHPELWEDVAVVTARVSNVGEVAGHTVLQLYVSFPSSTPQGTPIRVLRGFERVYLVAGETAEVSFRLKRRDVSYWDSDGQAWVVPEGVFTFNVGFSSRDLRGQAKLKLR